MFGFDKKKTKFHLVSFRLDDEHWNKLNALFDILDVHPKKDRLTEKMLLLIDRVDSLNQEKVKLVDCVDSLRKDVDLLKKEKAELEKKIQTIPQQPITSPKGPAQSKKVGWHIRGSIAKENGVLKESGIVKDRAPYPNEKVLLEQNPDMVVQRVSLHEQRISDAKKPKKIIQLKVEPKAAPKSEFVYCPDVDHEILRELCEKKCAKENFIKYSDCQLERQARAKTSKLPI